MTSTASAVELVQSAYDAFKRGDIAHVVACCSPDTRWVLPGGEDIPSAGVYIGREGVKEFFNRLLATENFTAFEPQQFFTAGDDVVSWGYEACTMLGTGKSASTNFAMKFTVRDGQISAFEALYDTAAYARAHRK